MKAAGIRVLFVQSATEIGGAENALLELTRRLSEHGIAPAVALLGFGNGPLGEQLQRAGVEVIALDAARFRNLLASGRTIAHLTALVRRRGFATVVANGGHPLLFARPAARLAGVPCVWWVHHVMPADPLRDHLIGVADSILGADYLIANSRQSGQAARRHFPGTPFDVIPPGIDTRKFAAGARRRRELREQLCYSEGDFVVGIFGRLQHNKGQHTAVQAAHHLRAKGVPAQVMIVGETQFGLDANYAGRLKHLVSELHLENCVRFMGQRDDVAELLAACDTAVQPAVVPESYGLTVVEAMAAGLPVIATRHGGPLETISDGETGMLYPPGDAAALCNALVRLHREPQLRTRLGAAAQAKALREFDATYTAAQFASRLRSIAGAGSNGTRPAVAHHAPTPEAPPETQLEEAASLALLK